MLSLREKVIIGLIVFLCVLPLLCLGIAEINYESTFADHIVTVTDKERHEDGYYLIFGETENGTTLVLKNDDNMFQGKFNSSDMYQQIKIGKSYKFYTVGWRNEFWSQYANILSFEEISTNTVEATTDS